MMTEIVDYAPHVIRTRQLLRQFDDAVLQRKWDMAKDIALAIAVEMKLAHNAVIHLSEMDK
jgi:hypothetical protein